MNNSKLKKITHARLFLPIVCLIAVLLINVIKTPDFFNITIRNGVLYGYVIDVINRASELVILAVGMTLVTAASGGQDISVGAVMAVAAAVCCQILSGGASSVTAYQNSIILAVVAALLASALCGAFNGLLVAKLNIQPMVATLTFILQDVVSHSLLPTDRLLISVYRLSRWQVDISVNPRFRPRYSLQS